MHETQLPIRFQARWDLSCSGAYRNDHRGMREHSATAVEFALVLPVLRRDPVRRDGQSARLVVFAVPMLNYAAIAEHVRRRSPRPPPSARFTKPRWSPTAPPLRLYDETRVTTRSPPRPAPVPRTPVSGSTGSGRTPSGSTPATSASLWIFRFSGRGRSTAQVEIRWGDGTDGTREHNRNNQAERGTMAILLALFLEQHCSGTAAFSIDMGFRYTRFRMYSKRSTTHQFFHQQSALRRGKRQARPGATDHEHRDLAKCRYPGANATIDTTVPWTSCSVTVIDDGAQLLLGNLRQNGTEPRSARDPHRRARRRARPGFADARWVRQQGTLQERQWRVRNKGTGREQWAYDVLDGRGRDPEFRKAPRQSACAVPRHGTRPHGLLGGPPSMGGPFTNPYTQ